MVILDRLLNSVLLLLLCAMTTGAFAAKSTTTLRSPIRLALIDEEQIAVTEFAQQKVLFLDAHTHSVRSELAIDGKPLGVAWGDGLLYVGNDTLGRIEAYGANRSGKWSLLWTGADQSMPGPADIEVDPSRGRFFVLSAERKIVFIFTTDGVLLSTLGGLHNPTALAVNRITGELYVSDYGDGDLDESPSVKIFDIDGSYLGAISGESGQSGFEFSRPQGLAATDRGEILLVDSLLGQVLIFDRTSLLGVGTLGSYGTQPGELRLPLDVVVDKDGEHVHVTNNRLGRIESFELEEDFE
jgi:DNA-binding beta-propeller fold protein YncE